MRKQRVYLETTMFNHYFDKEKYPHEATLRLFKEIKEGRYEPYTSTYVLEEIEKAEEPKKSNMLNLLIEYNITVLNISDDAENLAELYIKNNIIPRRFKYDGIHIAVASINELDIIFSVNFKHINKLKTKVNTDIINKNEGYKGVYICSPMEVVDYEN